MPLNSKSYLTVSLNTLLAGKDPKGVVLFTEVLVGGKRVSSNEHVFQRYKNLSLPRPQIETEVLPVRGGFRGGFNVTCLRKFRGRRFTVRRQLPGS